MSEKKPAQNKHMPTTTKVLIGVGAVAVVMVGVVLWASAVVSNAEVEKDYITPEELAQQTQQNKLDAVVSQLKPMAELYRIDYGHYPYRLEDFVKDPDNLRETVPDLSYIYNSDDSFTITYTDLDGKKVVINSADQ